LKDRIDRIEALIQQDVGRGVNALFAASRGGLFQAVSALSAARPRYVGILTGFFVPRADPAAAETDGPAGAALLALALSRMGVRCRVLTDAACRSACEAALMGSGLAGAGVTVPVDAVAPDADLTPTIEAWRAHGIDWMIAIERCGLSADGRPRNMRGEDVGAFAAPLDHVFTAGPWLTIAIGDGGNEVGMGALPAELVAREIPRGATIACVTPAEFLVTAGVSHWGAYGLIAGLAVHDAASREMLLECLDPETERRILTTLVRNGPAVDGVTLGRTNTIDGLELAAHEVVRDGVLAVARGG
jgi:hypothetical protein